MLAMIALRAVWTRATWHRSYRDLIDVASASQHLEELLHGSLLLAINHKEPLLEDSGYTLLYVLWAS